MVVYWIIDCPPPGAILGATKSDFELAASHLCASLSPYTFTPPLSQRRSLLRIWGSDLSLSLTGFFRESPYPQRIACSLTASSASASDVYSSSRGSNSDE